MASQLVTPLSEVGFYLHRIPSCQAPQLYQLCSIGVRISCVRLPEDGDLFGVGYWRVWDRGSSMRFWGNMVRVDEI